MQINNRPAISSCKKAIGGKNKLSFLFFFFGKKDTF